MSKLTKREWQIAELIAWGVSKKEVPGMLLRLHGGKEISVHTVENTIRNIFEKLGISKATELSAWFFCRKAGISWLDSPYARIEELEIEPQAVRLKKALLGAFLLLLLIPQLVGADLTAIRPARTARIERVQRTRTRRDENLV